MKTHGMRRLDGALSVTAAGVSRQGRRCEAQVVG